MFGNVVDMVMLTGAVRVNLICIRMIVTMIRSFWVPAGDKAGEVCRRSHAIRGNEKHAKQHRQ